MEELIKCLKALPKETLLNLIYCLMLDNLFSFSELADLHVKHIEALRKGNTEELMLIRSKVIDLWTGNKKDIGPKLVKLMQEAKDNGWANLSQEQIDHSKWNK